MSLSTNTKIYQKFNNAALLDQVSGLPLTAAGIAGTNLTPTLLPSGGYQMAQNQYLYDFAASVAISTQFTIPFWLQSVNQGIAQNPSSLAFSNMKMPLFVLGQGTFSSTTQQYTITNNQVHIYELALAGGMNQLVVVLNGTYTATTASYQAGMWHHFWIAWNGTSHTFQIFVDGVLSSLTTSGSIPSTISATTAGFWINPPSLTANYDVIRNTGILDEVAVLNTFINDPNLVQRAIDLSLDYVLDSVLSLSIETDLTILFDDPTAVKVTDMVDDGSYLFATQSDGKLLQGSPLLWAARKDYNNANENSVLKVFGTGATVSNGYLAITNGTVKL